MQYAQQRPEEQVYVRFFLEPVQDEAASNDAGRPVFADVEFIEKFNPGDRDNVIRRPLREADRQEFSRQYDDWKARNRTDHLEGTPLSEWVGISRSQAEELVYFKVRTVEELARVSDGQLKHIGPLIALRQKARDHIEQGKQDAPLQKLRAELESKDNEIQTLKQQMAEVLVELKASRKGKG